MAKTIHDLAVAYGKEHQGTVDIEDFEAGANAVLEELEYMLRHHYTTFNATATDVLNKIKQLKG